MTYGIRLFFYLFNLIRKQVKQNVSPKHYIQLSRYKVKGLTLILETVDLYHVSIVSYFMITVKCDFEIQLR